MSIKIGHNQHKLLDSQITSWELQQNAYVRHREQRFSVIMDALDYTRPDMRAVLDLAGGLGSFSKRILDRFSNVQVITLDYDPALLALAAHNLQQYGDRSTIIEANLLDRQWVDALGGQKVDAIVSSTALHWLPNADLAALYVQLARVLTDKGVFFNADHLSKQAPETLFHNASVIDDQRQQQEGFGGDVPDWSGWWENFRTIEGAAELIDERDRRFAESPENISPTPAFHTEALRAGGFSEVGTIWQYFDDYVVYGVR